MSKGALWKGCIAGPEVYGNAVMYNHKIWLSNRTLLCGITPSAMLKKSMVTHPTRQPVSAEIYTNNLIEQCWAFLQLNCTSEARICMWSPDQPQPIFWQAQKQAKYK